MIETISNAYKYSMAVAGLGCRQAKLSWQGSAQASSLLKVMSPSRTECGLYFPRLLRILMLLVNRSAIDHNGFLFDRSALPKQTLHALEWTALACVCWPVLHQYFVHGG